MGGRKCRAVGLWVVALVVLCSLPETLSQAGANTAAPVAPASASSTESNSSAAAITPGASQGATTTIMTAAAAITPGATPVGATTKVTTAATTTPGATQAATTTTASLAATTPGASAAAATAVKAATVGSRSSTVASASTAQAAATTFKATLAAVDTSAGNAQTSVQASTGYASTGVVTTATTTPKAFPTAMPSVWTTVNGTNSTNSSCADDTSPQTVGTTALAIFTVVCSSLFTTFGLFFQKIAQLRFSKHKEPKEKCKTWLIWLAGFLSITFISFGLDLYSMSTLGQSLVVPLLASLEVAENQLFAPFVLSEKLDKVYDITAAVIIILGAVLTTIFGPQGGGDVCEVDQILGLFDETPFLVFEAITTSILVACLSLMWNKNEKFDKVRFLMFAYTAGFLGGQQNLFLKGVGTLGGLAFKGEDVFGNWQIWVFVLGMGTLAFLQLVILNQGLARFPALVFIPSYTVLYIVMGTGVGLVFYQEYDQLDTLRWGMFGLGFVLIIVALALLTLKKPQKVDDADDDLTGDDFLFDDDDDFDEDLNSIELVQRGHHVLRAQNINVFNNLFGLPTAEDKPSGGKTHPVRRRSDGELDEVGGVAMSTLREDERTTPARPRAHGHGRHSVGHSLMLALGSVGGAVHVSHKLATRRIKSVAEHFFDEGKVGVHGNDSLLNAQHTAAGGRRLPAAHRHVASHHPVTALEAVDDDEDTAESELEIGGASDGRLPRRKLSF
eukprot:INCI17619.1.p1 GENE.INCI17619.1~~INCI17619.1.p1  ORF type:complete len:730 (+),score=114.03 INCI17619.1:231-2420(+)